MMKFLRALAFVASVLGMSLPAHAGTPTSVSWGIDRTVSPEPLCVFFGANCEPVGISIDPNSFAVTASFNSLFLPSLPQGIATIGTSGQFGSVSIGIGLAIQAGSLNLQPAQPAAVGGVESDTNTAHQWIAYIDSNGTPHQTQPSFADISGSLTPSQCPTFTSTSIGCVPPSGGGTTNYLRADGTFQPPPGGGSFNGVASSTAGDIVTFADTTGKNGADSGVVYNAIPSAYSIYTASGIGAVSRSQSSRNADFVSVFDFMTSAQIADVTGRTCTLDVSAAINAALTAVAVGTLYFPAGTYCIASVITINTGQYLVGEGTAATIIMNKPGTATALVQTANYSSLVGTDSPSGPYKFGLEELTLDGNKSNVTGSTDDINIYGYDFTILNVDMRNASADCWFSSWSSSSGVPVAAGGDGMEAHIYHLKTYECAGRGVNYTGPHDAIIYDLLTFVNGNSGLNAQDAVSGSTAGLVLNSVHSYGNGGSTNLAGALYVVTNLTSETIANNNCLNISGSGGNYSNVFAFGCTGTGSIALDVGGSNNHITNIYVSSAPNGIYIPGANNVVQSPTAQGITGVGVAAINISGSGNIVSAAESLNNTSGTGSTTVGIQVGSGNILNGAISTGNATAYNCMSGSHCANNF